ncbi:MAG: helix-turn-helix domain-containing protein [Ignavibacteriae bacterium]|nr:MAG: helix-turn-helix domain-containing protein [Ignavibacteriota bacterium]
MLKEFGQDLKRLRESKNITIAEVSAQTRINPKFIEKLEDGIFDFQPDTYIRAFLREYARSMNISEEQILGDYNKAKSGFYSKRSSKKEDVSSPIKLVQEPAAEKPKEIAKNKPEENSDIKSEVKSEIKDETFGTPKQTRKYDDEEDEEYSNKSWTQKILLILLILVAIAGIYYLYTYLNQSDNNQSNVKPKEFNETVEGYEQKLNGKQEDTTTAKDSAAVTNTVNDSLKLTVITSKDVRIKVYVDEKRIVEGEIVAKDSVIMFAKDQFRFSASGNSGVDIYLNGKYLKKPSHLSTNTIKNLVINKSGIVSE